MKRRPGIGLLSATISGLLWCGPGWAIAPEVRDQAKFFSPEAVKKANEQIREIMRKYHKDLLIETFPTVPADPGVEKVKAMSKDERNAFFHKWALERSTAAVVNGIYILVCKEPAHLQVEISPDLQAQLGKSYEKLIGLLLADFHERRFDDGLEKAVKFVREQLAGLTVK
jgi:hypothetical protein